MPPHTRFSRLCIFVFVWIGCTADNSAVTTSGCPCVGDCLRTLDSLAQPWCTTSQERIPVGTPGCGPQFSPTLQAYWDYCEPNVTSTQTSVALTTFSGMWTVMTISTVIAMSVVYAFAGCMATLLTSPQRTVYWLPCCSALVGACHGVLVGGVTSAILAYMYLSIPYALDSSVAISLGLAVSAFLIYAALGRQPRPPRPLHASEYTE